MSRPQQKSELNIIMGAMTFGEAGKQGASVTDIEEIRAILDIFQAHGHYEVDTARLYAMGTSEEYLAKADWKKRGLVVDTKLYPLSAFEFYRKLLPSNISVTHKPEDLRKWLAVSLEALNTDSIDLWYLHGPDRTTPFESTLRAVNELHKEGKLKCLGVSNYMSWEVAEMVGICKANGWIQPTVYQGSYNAVNRKVEPELFPCLCKFGIAFFAYNPLGGGFFTGRYHSTEEKVEPGTRFDPDTILGSSYRNLYWNEHYFKGIKAVEEVAKKHRLTLTEVALRWLSHHSLLKREHGDAIIIGASRVKHVEQNLDDLEKGPLPEEVVKALDEAWISVSSYAGDYFH
ncbi:Aldo/keto reductase [Pilatotrama ljubarskyi]|nr:Aldo/keto reductase [Pilatotrama ljubarskyi]